MLSLLDRVAATLLDAEPERLQSFSLLPDGLRQLAVGLNGIGEQNRSTILIQRATMLESLKDDPDAIRIILAMLFEEIADIQRLPIPDSEDDSEVVLKPSFDILIEPRAIDTELSPTDADQSDPELVAIFLADAVEHSSEAENCLLQLERNVEDTEALRALFRCFHSIKGSARFVNLHDLADLAQVSEDVLDAARTDSRRLDAVALQTLIDATDALQRAINTLRISPQAQAIDGYLPSFTRRLEQVLHSPSEVDSAPAKTAASQVLADKSNAISSTGAELGERQIKSSGSRTRESSDSDFDSENALRSLTNSDTGCSYLPLSLPKPPASSNLSAVIPTPVATTSAASRVTTTASAATAATPSATTMSQSPASTATASSSAIAEAVRVDRARLDHLINLVGELVICESMVQESFGDDSEAHVENRCLHQLRMITRELQELSLGLRMVPISSLFQKGMRLVRDLSRKLNKPVEVRLVGEDTEIDKTVADQISDPLVHIIRNSMDHGIESGVAERIAAGKAEKATIELKAFHQSGEICIEVNDDGRGLNRERIRQKAIERGLIKASQQLSDDDICDLIFRPGFSTAEKVTDLSGRGVGMDVVRQNIASLRGTVKMTSIEGCGTKLLIRLPLTLGIIDGMVVRSGTERFILPTSVIVELIQPHHNDISHIQHRGALLNVRGQSVPFFRLDRALGVSPFDSDLVQRTSAVKRVAPTTISEAAAQSEGIVVLVDDKDRMAGLYVDQVLGRQQVVIKGLQGICEDIKTFTGCAVMPDGLVGLILDVPATLEHARKLLSG